MLPSGAIEETLTPVGYRFASRLGRGLVHPRDVLQVFASHTFVFCKNKEKSQTTSVIRLSLELRDFTEYRN